MKNGSLARVAPEAPAMTLDEWASMPEDEPGELVEGHLVNDEVPDVVHETCVMWLIVGLGARRRLLRAGGRERRRGGARDPRL
jgi:hypothetical protein